ncbi:RNA polymerase sigma factor [Nonomuraea muscovyensis]|uniref:RNA polymerase sigma factor n=1 Tax=Nonomuraea muscovyensis TaxID=1124761 RepID=UPI0033C6BF00
MPGWPTADRAGDQRLVDALRRGDGPAALYDAYGERLHDYAFSLIGEGGGAADAVHDALVTAHGRVVRLRDGARLRAWLYALTRAQAVARLAHRPGAPRRGASGRGPVTPADPAGPETGFAGDAELGALVREALGEVGRIGREVLELSLRHGLRPAEAGAVLGLTSRRAATRLARARDHLENAAAAVVLARVGRAHCPDLSAMLDSWEGPLTPLLRRRVAGHIAGCEVCTDRRHHEVSAARLLGMAPVAYPPLSLRRRVVDTCLNPERDDARALILERSDGFDRTGFPVTTGRRSRRPRPLGLVPALVAAACLLATTGAVLVAAGDGGPAALPAAPSPGVSMPAEQQPIGSPEPDPGLTPEPSPDDSTPEPTATRPTATPRTTRPVTTKPVTGPTATRRAAPRARLGVTCPGGMDAGMDGAARVVLRARHASVTWSAGASQGLEVFPASGSIRAGRSATVVVTVADPDTAGDGTVSLSSNGGGTSCPLSWPGRSRPSDPPAGDPTTEPGTPEPSGDLTRTDPPARASADATAEPAHDS